jgi:hypothetical protein
MKKATYHPWWQAGRVHLRVAAFVMLATLWALTSCTREGETPVGAELAGDLLGSVPGSTFVDTFAVYADTVVPTYSLIDKQPELELGVADEYERLMILRPNLTGSENDGLKTVASARLRISMDSIQPSIRARFLNLGTRYNEGDRVETLDTTFVLTDPGNGDAEVRTLNVVALGGDYRLPVSVVQGWLSYPDSLNYGMVVAFTGTAAALTLFESRQTDGGIDGDKNQPQLTVTFTDNSTSTYNRGADATYVRPLTTTNQLIVSDGFTRRVWWRADLQSLGDSVAVNRAAVRFYADSTSVLGSPQQYSLYIPDSSSPDSPAFLEGADVSTAFVDTVNNFIEFPMTLTVQNLITGNLADNGLVFQYLVENESVRQATFFTSSAPVDSLRPRVIVTATTPAEFAR